MSEKWDDQCTSIKETDSNFSYSQKLIERTGCLEQNNKLTECLQKNKKDWRMCQVLVYNNSELKFKICRVLKKFEKLIYKYSLYLLKIYLVFLKYRN